jgi:hypothetical protein
MVNSLKTNFNFMVEVFITDIQTKEQAESISGILQTPSLKINYDLNETDRPYPCGHTILRVECHELNSEAIMATVRTLGFNCDVLEDKICH